MRAIDLYWLAPAKDLNVELRRIAGESTVPWADLVRLANTRVDFVQTNRIDKLLQRSLPRATGDAGPLRSLRIAMLSSSTADHLVPALRVAALRRNLQLEVFTGDFGAYRQALQDETSDLFQFKPDAMLFAFDAAHLLGGDNPALPRVDADRLVEGTAQSVRGIWQLARRHFTGQILQQTVLPVAHPLLGFNEHRLPGSASHMVDRLNLRMAELADDDRVDLLNLTRAITRDGLNIWHDPVLWHRAKQEISPLAAPAYGDMALRLIAAQQGRSAKCLVLDLDNTLWGGVVGDDGLEGLRLGQGSALGEAFVSFQSYARALAHRGVILAVCSKNDEENARSPFEKHPEMVLKLEDIACFVANWSDKAGNLRHIAERLNIGVDSLVFVDDNPFERNIVRRELPAVAVPELPEDPAFYAQCMADAGYFEALHVTAEDFERGGQYRANIAREDLRVSHSDLAGYLKSLNMELSWRPFDRIGLHRIVQLINKTNQFNLTTRRYTESDVVSITNDARVLTLQLRLIDTFGDNGIIGIVIGKSDADTIHLDTWLMSCRVLGRQVEEATMNLVVAEAKRRGAERLIGEYLPTKKNAMVRDHYKRLKFDPVKSNSDGSSVWAMRLDEYRPFDTFINIVRSAS